MTKLKMSTLPLRIILSLYLGVYQLYFEGDPRLLTAVTANPALQQLTVRTNPSLAVNAAQR